MTQQETLNDFINRRMAELGIGYKALTNAGIGAQTMVNIRKGKVTGLQLVTRQKLAEALRCSMGDIQAAIANTAQVTPFGEEVQKVPVKKEAGSTMKAVEKLADTLQEQGLLSEENQQETEESESVPDKTDTKSDESESILDKTDAKTDKCESVPRLPEMPKQPKLKRKKNSFQRFNRSRTCCGKYEHPDGGRVPAAAEGYVPEGICEVRTRRNDGSCIRGHRQRAAEGSAG